MKVFLGILSTIVVLTGATLTILALWGIQPISWTIVWKSGATIFLVCAVIFVLNLFYYIFFKNYVRDRNKKNK